MLRSWSVLKAAHPTALRRARNASSILLAVASAAIFAGCGAGAREPMSFAEFSRAARAASPEGLESADCNTDCAQRRLEFRYVVYVGKEVYCYWDEKRAETGVDYDRLATELEASITNRSTATDYYRTLRRWAASLHDGHVNVIPPEDLRGLDVYSSPVRLDVYAPGTDRERVFVTESGMRGQVEQGDELVALNGVPVRDAITAGEAEASGSTRRMRRLTATRRLLDALGAGDALRPARATFARAGRSFDVDLPRRVTVAVAPPASREAAPSPPKSGVDNVRATVLPSGLGYLRLDGFSGAQSEEVLDAAMRSLAPTRGLVIDLRMNGGGDLSGNRIIGRLIDKPVARFERSERLSGFYLSERPYEFVNMGGFAPGSPFGPWRPVTVEPIAEASYRGKRVAIVTSAFCFSACDTFSAAMKFHGLARVFGEATGGGTGTPLVFSLPVSGFQFRYSVVRGRTPDGRFIEGRGTEPDELVERSPADIGQDRDPQIARALTWAAGATGEGSGFHETALTMSESLGRAFGSVWKQGLEIPPTVREIQGLVRRSGGRDERAPEDLRNP